jgi:hypothetical protein
MAPALTELVVGDEASAWEAAGFAVDADRVVIAGVVVRLAGTDDPRGRGVLGWSLAGLAGDGPTDLDGLPTTRAEGSAPAPAASGTHPNGTVSIDHVVVMSPDLGRTVDRFAAAGLEVRRTRDVGTPDAPRRQVFFWVGDVILELVGPVEPVGDGPSRLWGLAFTVDDLDHTAEVLGERVGRVKDAVQRGRRITTLRHRDLDITVPIAFMSPHVPDQRESS